MKLRCDEGIVLQDRSARKYDFKIRILRISKCFLMKGQLVGKFLLALLKTLFFFFSDSF